MLLRLFKSSFVASIILFTSAQLYTVESFARTSFLINDLNSMSYAAPSVRPIAGRNRRASTRRVYSGMYPRAQNDHVKVSVQVSKVRINVLSNDSGNQLRIKEVNRQSAKGGRVYYQGGYVVYSPKAGFRGWDSFWYAIVDANGHRHSAKVRVCVCNM